jgi:hypothetical protein
MNFEEKIIERLKRVEREVERLRVKESPGAWLDWTPAQTGWTALPLGTYRYCRVGKLVIAIIYMENGSSSSGDAILSLPIKSAADKRVYGFLPVIDSGAQLTEPGMWMVLEDSTSVYFYADATGIDFTSSGTKLVNGVIIYEAA